MATRKKTTRDVQREKAAAAMPEVRKLVAKFGRTAVMNCLGKIKEHEKKKAKLDALKRETTAIEKELGIAAR